MASPNYRTLPVVLTPDEVRVRAMSAAKLQEEYCEIESRKKDVTRDLGQQLKTKRAEIEKNLHAVRTGKEDQLVQVSTRRNEDRRTIETVRMDTGEIIDSRAMTVEERQGKLFGIDGGKAKESRDDTEAAKAQEAEKAAAKKTAEAEEAERALDEADDADDGEPSAEPADPEAVLEDPKAADRFGELMNESRDSLRRMAPELGVSGKGGKRELALRILNVEIARANLASKKAAKSGAGTTEQTAS